MSMKLQIERRLDVTIMKFDGRITLGTGSVVYRNAVREAVWDGHKKLALDYSRITYFDSSGIGEMVAAFTMVRNAGGELVLFDLTKDSTDRLMITKLYSVFRVYDSLESALAYFDSGRSPRTAVKERRYGPASVLEVQGNLTEQDGASELPAAARKALDSGADSVVVLCPQVLDIDGFGGKVLLEAQQTARGQGGELVLAGIEERLAPAISKAGVSGLRAFPTVDEALRAFGLTVDRNEWRVEAARAR